MSAFTAHAIDDSTAVRAGRVADAGPAVTNSDVITPNRARTETAIRRNPRTRVGDGDAPSGAVEATGGQSVTGEDMGHHPGFEGRVRFPPLVPRRTLPCG